MMGCSTNTCAIFICRLLFEWYYFITNQSRILCCIPYLYRNNITLKKTDLHIPDSYRAYAADTG
ncbi:hypothetical protein HMPREF9406_1113 [Clostridium sp. HGF2]|nr:hypothetical protein HMPREF9406_1113 [Clostridium sp. HGF2]